MPYIFLRNWRSDGCAAMRLAPKIKIFPELKKKNLRKHKGALYFLKELAFGLIGPGAPPPAMRLAPKINWLGCRRCQSQIGDGGGVNTSGWGY